MKKFLFVFSLLLVTIVFNDSCRDEVIDECEGVVCDNGNCVLGTCDCNYGWEGTDCDVKRISSLYGEWTGELKCLTNTDTLSLKIDGIGSSIDVIKLNTDGLVFNFGNIPLSFDSYTLNGIVDSTFNSFLIDTLFIKQTIPFNGTNIEVEVAVSGDGHKKDNGELDLELDFLIKQFNQSINCQGVFEK